MINLLEKQQKNDNFSEPQLKVGNFSPALLGRIGRILLEGLLQIALKQSEGAIILVRVMEVGEYPLEFAE
jgi:hypothetical protein